MQQFLSQTNNAIS